MNYKVEFKPRSLKDIKQVPKTDAKRVLEKIEEMANDLKGDVKQLTNFTPEYRLRVGNYRVLFEIEENSIVIYRVRHRKEAYRK